jgi:predicted TIM-barrel fold metal-dependent hydrolase
MTRRNWFASLTAIAGGASAQERSQNRTPASDSLPLPQFEPRSMLHVKETKVPRSRFPVIDIHTHLSWSTPLGKELGARQAAKPDELLPVMDRRNIRMLVDLTGGYGDALDDVIAYWQKPKPGRFAVFTEPWWNKAADPNYPKLQGDMIERAARSGARGVKVLKTLGLNLRENITTGPLIKIDDRRFDSLWESAAAHRLPVAIHISDPEAFFFPIDRFNERWEELHAHPDWSFHGKDFPSNRELQEARLRVVARHPKTHFIFLHVGNAEDLGWVTEWMDKYPNISVEIGARIGELGRQPRAARRFFDRFQDRILFGTDAIPRGYETPQQVFGDELYEIYYRFLETEDEYFDYAPAKVPPQGRWRIYGVGLPEPILKKVYYENAERLLRL